MAADQKYIILAVDDERSNLVVLNKILSREFDVLTAKSGGEALTRVADDRPDLILLDIIMPDMSGFDVLAKLKSSQETRNIPVIIITGLSGEEDEERGFLLGAVDYITKPFKNAIVLARVRTHIQIVHQIRTIERLGLIDPLTDIANRRSFDDRMEIEWRRSIRENKPISFLMMDVDKFKNYNDTYGHPQGDTLLKTVAGIFASAARRPTDMAARLGGEEFGVLLPDTDLESALVIAETIRSNVESRRVPTVDGKTVTSATISIGVVTATPKDGDLAKDFLTKADQNLYTAKNTGRNRVFSGDS
ncbi:MAG: diguanylate cyclase [Synergistaceae bacterium]|jgi:diguanylate cyclase (GGDEF)-like protein|nr:diguanylate cyclase [Synergistaceae bacterium]